MAVSQRVSFRSDDIPIGEQTVASVRYYIILAGKPDVARVTLTAG